MTNEYATREYAMVKANPHPDRMTQLARIGAAVEIERARIEIRVFGEVLESTDPAKIPAVKVQEAKIKQGKKRGRKRKPMSAKNRKAVSERMTKYWAARRAAKAKGK